ncbi:MAG: prephenate dehydrogenase [Anaerolineae bacterium]
MKAQTIVIIGLGRIGASVGLALKQAMPELVIVGHDPDPDAAAVAKDQLGAVDKSERTLAGAVKTADILILTMPVAELEGTLQAAGEHVQEHTLILDLTGMKAAGAQWAERYLRQGHYVGASLVLAADHLTDAGSGTGADAARANLFRNSILCVMPAANADPKAVETAVNFGLIMGATPYFLDAAEFDSLVLGVETVPGLVAAAMFKAVHKAAGWRDMLRFAGLPFALATRPLSGSHDLALQALRDKAATLRWLDAVIGELTEMRAWFMEDEEEILLARLEKLEAERDRWLQERAENNWVEVELPPTDMPSLGRRFLGGFGKGAGSRE